MRRVWRNTWVCHSDSESMYWVLGEAERAVVPTKVRKQNEKKQLSSLRQQKREWYAKCCSLAREDTVSQANACIEAFMVASASQLTTTFLRRPPQSFSPLAYQSYFAASRAAFLSARRFSNASAAGPPAAMIASLAALVAWAFAALAACCAS